MVEWSITVVLKTTVPRGTGGSNPSPSAKSSMSNIVGLFFCVQSQFLISDIRVSLHSSYIFLHSFLRSNHRSFLRSGFIATSSMNRDMNQEGQAVFGSLKGVKVVGKRTDTVIDVTSSTLQA